MASAKFLEEALSTDVDESAVSAIVGSLENQLVTSTPQGPGQTGATLVLNQNHVNSAISNGGTVAPQKHGTIANGDAISGSAVSVNDASKQMTNNATFITSSAAQTAAGAVTTGGYTGNIQDSIKQEAVKIVYSQSQPTAVGQVMSGQGAIIQNRVSMSNQSLPNGTIGLSPQTVLQTTPSNVQQSKQPTIVLKTTGSPAGAPGLVTVPMNAVTSPMAQANNVGSPSTQSPNILSNIQVVNVRPGIPTQQQKGQPARVVLSAPQLVGARTGAPQGALLLKTENGQYQLLRVGPAPQTANLTNSTQPAGQPVTFRMQTVPTAVSSASSNPGQAGGTTTVTSTQPIVQQTQPVQRPANDNTKEKCRKFLANLLELSSREPKSVERNVRTLIQELIDNKVEPEDFCDKLERLLNASPQPCLIGFLKKSLPLLRYSLATHEMTIDGIRPPPPGVVFSIAGATPTVQTVRPAGVASNQQVRIVGPGATVVRPGTPAVLQQRLVTPIRAPVQQPRMVTAIRQPGTAISGTSPGNTVMVSNSQPPVLHPVYPGSAPSVNQLNQVQQQRPSAPRPVQVRPAGQGRPLPARAQIPNQGKLQSAGGGKMANVAGSKPAIGSGANRPNAKEKEKKSFSAAYAGDDDINDVAAMGGVNLAEETQKILGSTEFVGTQIRSCKEEIMCSMGQLQLKIRKIMQNHGLDEPATGDVAACVSHAAQERLKDLIEKLAIITEHRLEMVKSDMRYEITNDVKGQLKFLEDVDKTERKKREELEREMLLRAAKSRSKTEDPEQAKLKAKAKEMQRVEMEELRQREANATALQAIGPRKKPRLDGEGIGNAQMNVTGTNNNPRSQMPLRQRIKKVTLRDLQFLFESEKDLCRGTLLFKSYLK
ncbi:transcription initiation factor TFIID subunit 4 isoform X2 [Cylas formicarius]|uniref:transcription initiation factor TFIID subunit 4 isoform X2 n=1 Tax=Cylas formicarius TaxID=197179 RepID=UPI002958B2A7|nr:transcription initiation factor TFIID subunit 4 isoform X2 [Cylas formicarius]